MMIFRYWLVFYYIVVFIIILYSRIFNEWVNFLRFIFYWFFYYCFIDIGDVLFRGLGVNVKIVI